MEPSPTTPMSPPDARTRPSARGWILLMAATVALGLWSRWRVFGTPEADAIEYLERAQGLARGELLIDAQAIRSIGVSLLHAPYLFLADLLGVHQGTWVLFVSAAVHLLVTCLFVVGAVRLARALARSAGFAEPSARAAGWAAGLLCLASPSLLQYAAIPMADVAAGAAVAFGLVPALFGNPDRRSARRAGLLLGLAVLASFKAIPLMGLGLLAGAGLAFLRSGIRAAAGWLLQALLPVLALALLQGLSDWLTYGTFGAGIYGYLLLNLGHRIAYLLNELGFEQMARDVYLETAQFVGDWTAEDLSTDQEHIDGIGRHAVVLDGLRWFLPRVGLVVGALGAFTCVLFTATRSGGPSKKAARLALVGAAVAPLGIALLYADATLVKGSSAMRIWLPILPIVAAYGGVGLGTFAARDSAGEGLRPRSVLAILALGAALVQGVRTLTEWKPTNNAAFARAARWLRELETAGEPGLRAASSYHWAVLLRTPEAFELVKLPHQLDGLGGLSEVDQEESFEALASVDALILHWQLLRAEAPWAQRLVGLIEEEFELCAAFWDREVGMQFGPIMVFARPELAPDARRTLWRAEPGAAPGAPEGARMERYLGEVHEVAELTGARVERLPGDGLDWIELDLEKHGPLLARGYQLHLDVTRPDGSAGVTVFQRPAWGKVDLVDLPDDGRITEGFLVAPAQGGLPGTIPHSTTTFFGGEYSVWFDIATIGQNEQGALIRTGRLELMDPVQGDHAERDDLVEGTGVTDDGYRYLPATGGALIGTFGPDPEHGNAWRWRASGPLAPR